MNSVCQETRYNIKRMLRNVNFTSTLNEALWNEAP